ncbi:MAG: hypothetical protein V1944_01645, partial [Candidatus Aenigmatarchaeota archaeon]
MNATEVYIYSNLVLFLIWLAWFLSRPDLRKKMLKLALSGSIAGPVSQIWYLQDYWNPFGSYSFSGLLIDLVFAALAVSLTGSLYNVLFRMKTVPSKKFRKHTLIKTNFIFILFIIGGLIFFTNFLGINSIYSSAIIFLIISVIMLQER